MITEKYEETYEGDDLKCPYCGESVGDSWEIDFNDDQVEIECGSCEKKFWGSESVIRNFKGTADCELNGEKHDFVENYGNFKCKICGKFELKEVHNKEGRRR